MTTNRKIYKVGNLEINTMNQTTKERIKTGIGCTLIYGLGLLATIDNRFSNQKNKVKGFQKEQKIFTKTDTSGINPHTVQNNRKYQNSFLYYPFTSKEKINYEIFENATRQN